MSLADTFPAYQELGEKLGEILRALEQSGLKEEIDRLDSERSRLYSEKNRLDKNDVEAVKRIEEKLKENQTLMERLGIRFATTEKEQEQIEDTNKRPKEYWESEYERVKAEREKLLAEKKALDPSDVEAAKRLDEKLEWNQKELDWLKTKGIVDLGDNRLLVLMLFVVILLAVAGGVALRRFRAEGK